MYSSKKWVFQPPGFIRLDFSSSILNGLEQGYLAAPLRNAFPRNLYTTNSSTTSVAPFGLGQKLSGSSGYISAPTSATSSNWTIIVYASVSSTGVNALLTTADNPGGSTFDRSLYVTSGSKIGAYLFDGNGERVATSSGSISANVPFLAAGIGSGTNLYGWLNNEKFGPTITANNGFTGYVSPKLVAGYGGGGSASGGSATISSSATIAYALKLNRAISDGEWYQLVKNPWQIFASSKKSFFIFDGSPAAVTNYEFQSLNRGVGRGIARGIA